MASAQTIAGSKASRKEKREILLKDVAKAVSGPARQVTFSAGERALFRFYRTNKRRTIGLAELADRLNVSRVELYRATRGLPFRKRFGESLYGAPLCVFYATDLRKWARTHEAKRFMTVSA